MASAVDMMFGKGEMPIRRLSTLLSNDGKGEAEAFYAGVYDERVRDSEHKDYFLFGQGFRNGLLGNKVSIKQALLIGRDENYQSGYAKGEFIRKGLQDNKTPLFLKE